MVQINLALNGIPGTLWEIRRQENIHPYLGLRQAILIINAQEKALRDGRLSQKKAKLSLKKQQELISQREGDELEILLDEINIAKCDIEHFDQLILDAETELNIAIQERDRIESLNPGMAAETYESLQAKYANEAFRAKLSRALVISIYGNRMGLSEGTSEVIYDSMCFSAPERQSFLMNIENQVNQLLVGAASNQENLINGGINNGFIVN